MQQAQAWQRTRPACSWEGTGAGGCGRSTGTISCMVCSASAATCNTCQSLHYISPTLNSCKHTSLTQRGLCPAQAGADAPAALGLQHRVRCVREGRSLQDQSTAILGACICRSNQQVTTL